MKEPEYIEGPEAAANWGKRKDKPTASRRKAKSSDED